MILDPHSSLWDANLSMFEGKANIAIFLIHFFEY